MWTLLLTPPFFLLCLHPIEELDTPVELLRLVVSEPLSQVSVWDPCWLRFPLLPLLQFFLFRSQHFHGGSFILRGVEGVSHWVSWWEKWCLCWSISHSQGSDSSGGGGSQRDKWLGCGTEITPSVPKPP